MGILDFMYLVYEICHKRCVKRVVFSHDFIRTPAVSGSIASNNSYSLVVMI